MFGTALHQAIDAVEDSNREGGAQHPAATHSNTLSHSNSSENLEMQVEDDLLLSRPLLDSGQRNDQKGLGYDNDGNLGSRRANDAPEGICSVGNQDNKTGSCGLDSMNTPDQAIEAVDSQDAHASPGLRNDSEDRLLQSRKPTQLTDEMHQPPLQTSAEDDIDQSDSEVEEEDVKVCDICGDAGREDLLAVCSRCSDGAEHTYCMREMLDKVPEGDWLCEECKVNEELEARKQEHSKVPDTNEKTKSFERTSSINSSMSSKSDNKESFCEKSKLRSVSLSKQVSSKRSGDSIEAVPTPKRQAIESSIGSPTGSSPKRVPLLSKDSSFKNLDKMKGKPTNQTSTGTESTGDSSEHPSSLTSTSLHAPKGNFVKSNSFSSSNAKLNVKVSDEVSHKQKLGVDAKDIAGKLINKSMSFKGLSRSSVSEPKVKMLSPKCTPVQELKGQKQGRERISFERKNTIKLDNPFPGPMVATSGKRPLRGDNMSTLSGINGRDNKNAVSDGKLSTSSKNACHSANKSSDVTANIADVKRPSSTSTSGSVLVNGTSSYAQGKPSLNCLKEGQAINSCRTADRSVIGPNGAKTDVLDNQSEKSSENSFGRSRHGVNPGMVGGLRRGPSTDTSVSRTKEGINEENKLKAAIEAAMQKKQDIFKKNRIPEKSTELLTSNTQGNYVGDADPITSKAFTSEEAKHDGDAVLFNNSSNTCKQTSIGSARQFKVYPADCVPSLIGESVLTASPIPEYESVWQGGFEIRRSGKLSDICGGFQAHLSSAASGKVLEVVKKFPQKIILDEVPRPCAWPLQFKGIGAREDNIALYFFARDHESFVRSYKILLDYLMKHDLALRGHVNGVELLVFPSNHLPYKSQCWNTLFFMWGVFRGRRLPCTDDRSGSLEMPDVSMSNLIPLDKDVLSSACPEDSSRPAVEDLSVSGSGDLVVSPGSGVSNLRSGSLSNGDCYNQRCSVGRTCSSSQTSAENSQKTPENHFPGVGAEVFSESGSAILKDHCDEDPNIATEQWQSTQAIGRGNHLQVAKKSSPYLMQDKQDISSHSSKLPLVVEQDGGSVGSFGEQQVLDTVDNNNDDVKSEISFKQEQQCMNNIKNYGGEVKLENDLKQEEEGVYSMRNDRGKLKVEGSLKQEGCVDINVSADDNMEELHSLQFSPKRHSPLDSTESLSQAASLITPKMPWMDKTDPLDGEDQASTKKRIKGGDGSYGCDPYRLPTSFSDSFSTRMLDVSTSSLREDTSKSADDEKLTSANAGSTERYFFLVDSQPSQSIQPGHDSVPWKVGLSESEDRLPDGSPNLELALGVDKNQSRKGVFPLFAEIIDKKDPDRPPDIATSKEEDEDGSASLSLSLAFPFSDKQRPTRLDRPSSSVEQSLAGRHEANTSLLLFRGSSGK